MINAGAVVIELLKSCLFVSMLDSELEDHLEERKQTLRDFRVEMMVKILNYESGIKSTPTHHLMFIKNAHSSTIKSGY
jgi:hypothetical protein